MIPCVHSEHSQSLTPSIQDEFHEVCAVLLRVKVDERVADLRSVKTSSVRDVVVKQAVRICGKKRWRKRRAPTFGMESKEWPRQEEKETRKRSKRLRNEVSKAGWTSEFSCEENHPSTRYIKEKQNFQGELTLILWTSGVSLNVSKFPIVQGKAANFTLFF